MTLSIDDAMKILSEYGKGAAWTAHCKAVAGVADRLGDALARYLLIDREFLWSAALLHDIGRYKTHDPIRHGVAGYELLTALGHHREAAVCASHILFGLAADEAVRFGLPDRDFMPATIEERLVPLVDFLIEFDAPTSLERRFLSLAARNSENSFFIERLDRAKDKARFYLSHLSRITGEPVEGLIALRFGSG